MDGELADFLKETIREQIDLLAKLNKDMAAKGDYSSLHLFAAAIDDLIHSLVELDREKTHSLE